MRKTKRFHINEHFTDQLTCWVDEQTFGVCFRGNGWGEHFGFSLDALAAVGIKERFSLDDIRGMNISAEIGDYLITHLTYDIKNRLEDLRSQNPDCIRFAESGFTVPELVVVARQGEAEFQWHGSAYSEAQVDLIFLHICEMNDRDTGARFPSVEPEMAMSREEYYERFQRLQRHIQRGDVYQANLCQEFYWRNAQFDPAALFNRAYAAMPNPFSVFYKYEGKYCLGFSPERFLSFTGTMVLSQPMKGTAPRSLDAIIDQTNKEALRQSEKDRRENVMIVDMVRNDLSHFARPASVRVPELYRIKTYPRVHQMYSTITAEIKEGARLLDVLLKAFPMGSMTGAPKVKAMQLIEELELTKRGLFSGAIGFITPGGDADFNVVIRSLLYNPEARYLSVQVGGGITAMSAVQDEYEECLVKFEPIRRLVREICTKDSQRESTPTFAA